MANVRELKRRIRSVKNISQVTRAMQMVAASKMRRAQEQVLGTRPYTAKAWEILLHLAAQRDSGQVMHPLLTRRDPISRTGIILITSDKGLCGAYNTNIIRATLRFMRDLNESPHLITVGRRGRDFMIRHGGHVVAEFSDLPDFINTLPQEPTIRRVLPIIPEEIASSVMREYIGDVTHHLPGEFIYEPSAEAILATVLPRFTELQVYQAILEALASEHSARMVAMRNATENANELIDDLTLSYYRARQEAITREMLDIAGGAEALAGLA
jgi:F-type H+-transporting ATPase subunit gamma